MSTKISALNYYPIKSCGGVTASELEVVESGFRHDRNWMVVDEEGTFMSQRKTPRLALIAPEIYGDTMAVTAPSMEELVIPLDTEADKAITVRVHKNPAVAQSMGARAAGWFSEYLQAEVTLVQPHPDFPRQVKEQYRVDGATNRVGFADSFAFLLASKPSLAALNATMAQPIPMDRFRPNIVVDGVDLEPYDEDYWRKVQIGDLQAFVVRACDRCAVPDTDQATGERPDRSVTAALSRTRRGIDRTDSALPRGNFFGQNLNHVFEPGTTLRVGDEVAIVGRSVNRNIIQ